MHAAKAVTSVFSRLPPPFLPFALSFPALEVAPLIQLRELWSVVSSSSSRDNHTYSHQTRLLGSNYIKNAFAAGDRPQTHFWCI